MTEPSFEKFATARPADRFESWHTTANPTDFDTRFATYLRVSKEVSGSTFHKHGSMDADKIDYIFITTHASRLRGEVEKSSMPDAAKQAALQDIDTAQADLSQFAAYRIINQLRYSRIALSADDIVAKGKSAQDFFERSRIRHDILPSQERILSKTHDRLVREAKYTASVRSVTFDTKRIKEEGSSLSEAVRATIAQRANQNIDELLRTKTDENSRILLENMRANVYKVYEAFSTNVTKKQPVTYVC